MSVITSIISTSSCAVNSANSIWTLFIYIYISWCSLKRFWTNSSNHLKYLKHLNALRTKSTTLGYLLFYPNVCISPLRHVDSAKWIFAVWNFNLNLISAATGQRIYIVNRFFFLILCEIFRRIILYFRRRKKKKSSYPIRKCFTFAWFVSRYIVRLSDYFHTVSSRIVCSLVKNQNSTFAIISRALDLCTMIDYYRARLYIFCINYYCIYSSGNNGYQVFVFKRDGVRPGDEGLRTFGRSGLQ